MVSGIVAIDGTKLHANASRDANVEYDQIAAELVADAIATDAAEDELYGERRGDELPEELQTEAGRREWLAPGDPFGLVLAILLTPLLLFGYQVATMLKAATKVTAGPLLGVTLMGFALVATLLIDLIAGPWLGGVPSAKFWILWPIMALIMSVVALFAAVMQRLLGAAGTLLTVVVIIMLGKPSSGGANGVPYLPGFWTVIGPYLPPRNAYILMRNSVYFGGHGTAQALIILLAYFLVFAIILGISIGTADPSSGSRMSRPKPRR